MVGLLALLGIAAALLLTLLTAMVAWNMTHPPRRTAAWAIARSLPSDPGELNLPFEEWKLDRGTAKSPVWEISSHPEEAEKSPLTAVFVHGWGHGRVNSLQRIDAFVPLVERIVLYDLRGHGDSTARFSPLGDREEHDLLALLERLGPGRYVLVGHSMGAVIALRAALKMSGQVAGVIAYGPYCEFHQSLRGRLRVNEFPARPVTDLALIGLRALGVRPSSLDPASLRDLTTPVLVIHGVEDRVSPLEHARRIVEALPDAELFEVREAAHADAHRVDQAAHDAVVRGFIKRLRAH